MIQGGDSQGTGGGGPGYTFKDECLPNSSTTSRAPLHGQPRPEDQREAVLHHAQGHPVARWQAHHLWPRREGQDVVNKIAGGDTINSIKILRIGDRPRPSRATRPTSISFPSNPRQHSGQDGRPAQTRRLGFGLFSACYFAVIAECSTAISLRATGRVD